MAKSVAQANLLLMGALLTGIKCLCDGPVSVYGNAMPCSKQTYERKRPVMQAA
jgi:hypothetical protein